MAYKKPQDPLTNNGFGIYPLTTADQVILSDGSRLEKNGQISIGGGTVKTVSGVAPDSAGNVALMASDVGARPDTWMPSASDVGALPSDGTAENAGKLGGKTLAEIMLDLYPVGAVYISVNSTSPASLFGGTWEQLQDRFLLGAGGVYNEGSTGGEATVALSLAQMPEHGHAVYVWDNAGTTGNAYYYNGQTKTTHNGARLYNSSASEWIASGSTASAAGGGRGDPSGGTNQVGSGSAHNNMPPYLAVYMWKRVS